MPDVREAGTQKHPPETSSDGRATPRAVRVRATVLFADLVGFTRLSELLGAEAAYAHLTGCAQLLDGVIRRQGGSVDKYLGDALMAVFGHPVPREDSATAAIDAALEMQSLVADYNAQAGLPEPIGLCIGINSGPMISGDIRGKVIREFHVLGDTVNTAARLKSKAPLGSVFVGAATRAEAGEAFVFRTLEPLRVKGKEKPVPAFEPVERTAAAVALELGPFVGRRAELEQLAEAQASLTSGRGRVVQLSGPEGSGKSRLLSEFLRRSEDDGLDVLRADAGRGLEACLAALRTAPVAAPCVLAVDDAGDADARDLASLGALVRERPVLALLAGRAEALPWIAAAERIEPGPLDDAEAEELLDGLIAGGLDEAARALVLERSRGNPLRLTIGAFLGGALASESERDSDERTTQTERRRSTVLFADLSGFTAMSEKMEPEEAYPVVADCLALLDGVARKHGGTVDKYLGDCVLALFGAPKAMEDSPRAAVNAAIEMIESVQDYSRERQLEHPLEVHIGINTGLGISGDVSGPLLREFAMMGDPVVIASELTDRATSGEIYVGAETWKFTREGFDYGEAESLALKDRTDELPVYALTSRRQRLQRVERQVFSELIGRDAELEQLQQAFSGLQAGRGGIVTLMGRAGVGKSRLLSEVARRAGEAGISWQEGCSISTGRQSPYHPFADLCRSWAGITDDHDEAAARTQLGEAIATVVGDETDDLFPLIGALMGLRLEAAEAERLERMQGEFRERLLRAAVNRILRFGAGLAPVAVVLDDLHWADDSSLELLESLFRLADSERILFLCVSRPDFPDTSGRIAAYARAQHGERLVEIDLAPLEPSAARALIKSLFRGGDIPHATRRTIEEKSEGNPFYIEEVVRSLLDQGAVEFSDGAFHATDTIGEVEIPGTVQDVVMSRVDRLPLRRRGLLQVAAVMGHNFHKEVLAAFGETPEHFQADLQALLETEFLMAWDRFPGEEYAFKHPLIQEVTYDGIVEEQRLQLHCQVANAIEAHLPADVPGLDAMLAYHYSVGRDLERAEQYLFRAGDQAARVAASSEALRLFREASRLYLEMHGNGGDSRKKAALEKNVGLALYHRGQLIDADEHLNNALRLLGEPVADSAAGLILRFGRSLLAVLASLYLSRPGRTRRAATEVDLEVIELMMKRAEAQTTADPKRFLFDSMETLARLDRVDARTVRGAGGMYAGTVGIFSYGGLSFRLSERFLGRAAELVHDDDPDETVFFQAMSFLHHLLSGDWSDRHMIEDADLREALAVGRLWPVTNYLNLEALKRIYQGDYAGADARIAWLREIAERYEHDLAASAARALSGIGLLERRRLDDAIEALDLYYDEHPEAPFKVSALGNRAEAQMLASDLDGALETLERAERYRKEAGRVLPYHLSSFLRARYRADVELLARDGAESRELRRRAAASGRAAEGIARKVAWRRAEIRCTAGKHAWLLDRHDDARKAWQAGLDEAERLGARADAARIHLAVAHHAAEAGPDEPGLGERTAAEHRALGRETLASLGIDLHAEDAFAA